MLLKLFSLNLKIFGLYLFELLYFMYYQTTSKENHLAPKFFGICYAISQLDFNISYNTYINKYFHFLGRK